MADDGARAQQKRRSGGGDAQTDGKEPFSSRALSKTCKATFLDHLAATCNVAAAAEAAGMRPTSAYQLRRRDTDFAAGWGEALVAGYELLELQLVGHALSGGNAPTLKGNALTGVLDDYRLAFEGGETMTGRFLVTRLDYAGDFNGERSYTLSLESSGQVSAG